MKKTRDGASTKIENICAEGIALRDEYLGRVVGGVLGRAPERRTQAATLTLNSDADIAFDFG